MSYAYKNQDGQKQEIVRALASLMNDLQGLAPHPDMPDHKGPLFIKSNHNLQAANDHDGMFGSLLLESFLGTAFADAISESFGSWTQDFDAMAALECYSAYITDVENSAQKASAHGQGTLARLSGQSISKAFNLRSSITEGMQAFMNDMPKRMKIETAIKNYLDALETLDNAPVYAAAPRLAA